MNKILSAAAITVALVTTLSFAQEGCKCPKFGIRAGFNLNDFTGGDSDEFDIGFGFGGGIAVNIPIADFLSFNPELGFYYRKLASMSEKDAVDKDVEYYHYLDEFALSIPAMLRFAPNGMVPFYLAAGVQLDIPFSTKSYSERSYKGDKTVSAGKKIDERAEIDFGIALGLGYNITPNFGIDLRCVIGLTDLFDVPNLADEDEPDISLNQYGIGVTYFF
jgi:opacity protein-like surface antigen